MPHQMFVGPMRASYMGGLIVALPQIVKAKNGAGKPPPPQLRSIDHLGQHTHNWVKGSSRESRCPSASQPTPSQAPGPTQPTSKTRPREMPNRIKGGAGRLGELE